MPLPELEAKRVDVELKRFAERVPPHARSQVWYKHVVRGNAVTLFECRPYFKDATQTTEQPVARFTFDPKTITWSLDSADRNGRWCAYDGLKNVRGFATVVAEVEGATRAPGSSGELRSSDARLASLDPARSTRWCARRVNPSCRASPQARWHRERLHVPS